MSKPWGISTTIVGAISGVAFTVICVLALGAAQRASAVAQPPTPSHTIGSASSGWPLEIQNIWSALPQGADTQTTTSDEQCATVQAGLLAHCVRVQCKRRDEQTACVEVLMTARRVPPLAAPSAPPADRPSGSVMRAAPLPAGAAHLRRTSQSS